MRKEFKKILYNEMSKNSKIFVIVPDLGFKVFDDIKKDFGDRFIQCQATENLALGIATGLAINNLIPIVYSITPFLLSTAHSFLRNYLNHEKIPVKLLSVGRNKNYIHDGFTHWADDAKDILNNFKNIIQFWPETNDELINIFSNFLYNNNPSFLNLIK